jgi:hypothetical protein
LAVEAVIGIRAAGKTTKPLREIKADSTDTDDTEEETDCGARPYRYFSFQAEKRREAKHSY